MIFACIFVHILKGECMQIAYKTISSVEFDVLSGTYKTVQKQVEDENSFSSLLDSSTSTSDALSLKADGDKSSAKTNSLFDFAGSDTSSTSEFGSDFQTSLYAYRFRQNENELLQAKESNQASLNETKSSNVMNDLLSSL